MNTIFSILFNKKNKKYHATTRATLSLSIFFSPGVFLWRITNMLCLL